jgi:hypothetical protein
MNKMNKYIINNGLKEKELKFLDLFISVDIQMKNLALNILK